ncbi:flagellin [Roseisolibacter sp. H3M3-2]|uniref:flagellin n=1 Tax=Roseisolibacter sp. H3M3-2 TaxID=3031323 RepID=UPI0023DA2226|nr:flagellin [Roseisolibacter sp. H3M3-2]MDF1503725.1 flagellin [Roseisolibacter sp. H3M3-2]
MKIQTNNAANFALRNMSVNSQSTERSIQRLSSGFRINRAGDDAAGLAIANKFRAENRALGQAQKNASQGTAMLQVMDGAIQTVSSILDRMKELATAANSDSIGTQRDKLNAEFTQLRSEIDRIAQTTKYQGTALVNGTFGSSIDTADVATNTLLAVAGVSVQATGAAAGTYTFTDAGGGAISATATIGGQTITQAVTGVAANSSVNFDKLGLTVSYGAGYVAGAADGNIVVAGGSGRFQVGSSGAYGTDDTISVTSVNLRTTSAGLNLDTLSITTSATAVTALGALDSAINSVNTAIGNVGSAQSRFDFASANVAVTLQNSQAAESTIRDADMAYEMSQFTKSNILSQAAQSMLSQANQGTQGILQLLRG